MNKDDLDALQVIRVAAHRYIEMRNVTDPDAAVVQSMVHAMRMLDTIIEEQGRVLDNNNRNRAAALIACADRAKRYGINFVYVCELDKYPSQHFLCTDAQVATASKRLGVMELVAELADCLNRIVFADSKTN